MRYCSLVKLLPCYSAEDLWAQGNQSACRRPLGREQPHGILLQAIATCPGQKVELKCHVCDGPGRQEFQYFSEMLSGTNIAQETAQYSPPNRECLCFGSFVFLKPDSWSVTAVLATTTEHKLQISVYSSWNKNPNSVCKKRQDKLICTCTINLASLYIFVQKNKQVGNRNLTV